MNAVVGATGQVNELQTDNEELQNAIQESEGRKFKALFDKEAGIYVHWWHNNF